MKAVVFKMIRINGLYWTLHVIPYVLLRKIFKDLRLPKLDRKIKNMEKRKNLAGINCLELNSLIWNSWNWEKSNGEEWTKSKSWKQSLINDVMMKYFSDGKTILEIGPGAGKWTVTLQQFANQLILVDISSKCIEICRNRFSSSNNILYYTNDGFSLSFMHDESIDYIWSFDAFVHIPPDETANYFKEFSRVLKKNGKGIIHHAANGGLKGGWRSNVTNSMITQYLRTNNLTLIAQFDS